MRGLLIAPLLALACVACSSVDQIPLVYVSSVKVGVDVASGTVETPGAKLMLGVGVTDAAYVPVAVARRCPDEAISTCKATDFPIDRIWGDSSLSQEQLIQQANAQSNAIGRALEELQSKLSNLNKRTEETATAQRDVQHLAEAETVVSDFNAANRDGEQPSSLTAEVELARTLLTSRETVEQRLRSAQAAKVQADRDVEVARSAVASAEEGLDRTLAQRAAPNENRRDALSVFGSFNGNLNGGSKAEGVSGGVTLGKSFATGIAAQQLSGWVGKAAIVSAKNECLRLAITAVDGAEDSKKKELMSKLIASCAHSEPPPVEDEA